MAGHKGYAISFMMDVLSGVLTGSSFGSDVVGPYVPDQRSGCGHLVIAIDIAAIMPPEQFNERMDRVHHSVKNSRPAPGEEILVPGELENRSVTTAAGTVTLPAKTVEELNELAEACGVQLLAPGADDIHVVCHPGRSSGQARRVRRRDHRNAAASLRDELGCLAFDVHQDIAVPTRFHLYEIYVDEDAFRIAHRSSPHYTRWQGAAKRAWSKAATSTLSPVQSGLALGTQHEVRPHRRGRGDPVGHRRAATRSS